MCFILTNGYGYLEDGEIMEIIGIVIIVLLTLILLSTIRITMYIEATNMRLNNIENKMERV